MDVHFIFHSGFAVVTDRANLIFDCWKDPAGVVPSILSNNRLTYFFASHRHPDHFSPDIFQYANLNSEVIYILSSDIKHSLCRKGQQMVIPARSVFLRRGETYCDKLLDEVCATPSTDVGISFCIRIEDASIFHAGDLNYWHWRDESTPGEIKKAYGDFTAALRTIEEAGYARFNLAMFPVDSRIGTDYPEGARIFLRTFKVDNFFPMHFTENPQSAIRFNLYRNPDYGRCFGLIHPGDMQKIEIK